MPASDIIPTTKERMQKSVEAFQREIATIRAGVANASILDRVMVNYYGVPTPLNQIAGITVPEARMLMISPYDKGSLAEIEKAILQSDIGITPNNSGDVIRLVIPPLTKERREELSKVVGKEQEGAKVAVRNIRRDMIDDIKKLEKSKDITEDDVRTLSDDIQKVTDQATDQIDKLAEEKINEIMND